MNRKRVCMFVWNHFTNDARVLRECTALSENNFHVDLICIHDPNTDHMPYIEKRNDHFYVYRVERYPMLLLFLQKLYRACSADKGLGGLLFLVWGFLIYLLPATFLPLTLLAFFLLKTKLTGMVVKGSIILRMILRGYSGHYDFYHANDLNTLPQAYVCAKWRLFKKGLIYDSHEVQTSRTGYHSPIYGQAEKFLVQRVDSMIVENHMRAKYNEELYGFYPNVVHNYPFKASNPTTDQVNLQSMLGLPEEEKILLYQGGIQTGRGLEKVIQAAAAFTEGTIVFIGDGKLKPQLEQMVIERNLQDKIKFLPKVPLSDLPSYSRTAYLGFQVLNNVCFNHYSASSNKLFEYMMAGVPIVACDFPEIKRVVEREQIGITVNSHDPKKIAAAVNHLLQNPELREQFSKNCLSASETYNWEKEQHAFLHIYRNLEPVPYVHKKPFISQLRRR